MNAKNNLHVIVGLGITGLSCVRYLVEQNIPVAVTDSRVDPPSLAELKQQFPQVPISVGGFDEALISQAQYLVVSPGVSLDTPVLQHARLQGIKIIGDIELFARSAKAPIIAITGSNGKTTVTTLVGLMLQRAGYKAVVCGNIGTPVLDALHQEIPDFYVLELSSFQLDTTQSLRAIAATALNVTPDHMDRYATYADYLRSKQHIYHGCKWAIVPSDQPEIWQELGLAKQYTFGIANADFTVTQNYLSFHRELLLSIEKMKLQGQHHVQNALAALALCQAVGAPLIEMLPVLAEFGGLAHRCQWVAEHGGVAWYNDSKGTNVGASVAAIGTLGPKTRGKIVLIAGGDAKAADLIPLREPVKQYVRHVVLIGKDAKLLEQALQGAVDVTHAASLPEAVDKAARIARPGDNVLLSPACASLDMFKNYEHRGQVFVDAVKQVAV